MPLFLFTICSVGFLGGLFIMFGSVGSMPNARAGRPSVARFIHRICNAVIGSGQRSSIAVNTVSISPMLLDNRYSTNFFMLSNILLPSSTAFTIVVKLSSASTMSLASFATSVPVIPIAIPKSAFFSAGASFTPSPVIATMCPFACSALMIFSL